MTQTGVVTRLMPLGLCEVLVTRKSACARDCADCGGCAEPEQRIRVLAGNAAKGEPGDTVEIASSTGLTLGLAFVVFILPLILFIVGFILHPVVGAACVLLGVLLILVTNRIVRSKGGIRVSVIRIVSRPTSRTL